MLSQESTGTTSCPSDPFSLPDVGRRLFRQAGTQGGHGSLTSARTRGHPTYNPVCIVDGDFPASPRSWVPATVPIPPSPVDRR